MFTDLLAQHFVHTALLAGAVVAVVSGAIGIFVVTRGASFAVHAISELGFTGAAGALVIGIDPVIGMIGGSLVVGLVLGVLSLRGRERDSAISRSCRLRARCRRPEPVSGLRDRSHQPALREHRRGQ
jgi:ABC-type Mn2+/Zn2+ transport system permease subunit